MNAFPLLSFFILLSNTDSGTEGINLGFSSFICIHDCGTAAQFSMIDFYLRLSKKKKKELLSPILASLYLTLSQGFNIGSLLAADDRRTTALISNYDAPLFTFMIECSSFFSFLTASEIWARHILQCDDVGLLCQQPQGPLLIASHSHKLCRKLLILRPGGIFFVRGTSIFQGNSHMDGMRIILAIYGRFRRPPWAKPRQGRVAHCSRILSSFYFYQLLVFLLLVLIDYLRLSLSVVDPVPILGLSRLQPGPSG